jgi:hypothetical protein
VEIGNANKQLTTNIAALQRLNSTVTENIQNLSVENKNLTEQNIELTDKTKGLVVDVNKATVQVNQLLDTVRNEQTGGNSIPLIRVYRVQRPLQLERDRWVIEIIIENHGGYPLQNLKLRHGTRDGKLKFLGNRHYKDTTIAYLHSGDHKLFKTFALEPSGLSEPSALEYEIIIRWKKEYSVYFTIVKDFSPRNYPHYRLGVIEYQFKGQKFSKWLEVKAAILADFEPTSPKGS